MTQKHKRETYHGETNFCHYTEELCLKYFNISESQWLYSNKCQFGKKKKKKQHSRKRPNILASTTCKEDKFYIPANQQDQCWEKFDLCEGSHSVKTKKKDAEDGGSSRINPRFSVIQPLTRPQKNHDQGHWKTTDSSKLMCSATFQFSIL